MTTTTSSSKTAATQSTPAPAAAAPTPDAAVAVNDGVEPETEKKKKKKYTRQLKSVQKGEVGLTKGTQRLARAIEEGLGVWRKRRNKSARKRRDGGVRDLVQNVGKSVSEFSKIAAKIPEDVADALPRVRR